MGRIMNEVSRLDWFHEKLNAHEMSEGQARIWRFTNSVMKGQSPCQKDIEDLALCFEKILEGEDPRNALGLNGIQSQGRKARTGEELFEKEIFPVLEIERLRSEGKTLEYALCLVGKEMQITEATLTRYHKRWRKNVKGLIAQMGMHLNWMDDLFHIEREVLAKLWALSRAVSTKGHDIDMDQLEELLGDLKSYKGGQK